jgi:hypothetical protein
LDKKGCSILVYNESKSDPQASHFMSLDIK